jgi:hypothetical protein
LGSEGGRKLVGGVGGRRDVWSSSGRTSRSRSPANRSCRRTSCFPGGFFRGDFMTLLLPGYGGGSPSVLVASLPGLKKADYTPRVNRGLMDRQHRPRGAAHRR